MKTKDIEGFSDYEITEDGKVFRKWRRKQIHTTIKATSPYVYVALCIEVEPYTSVQKPLHKLVARAFCDNPDGHTYVKHLNGKLWDNRAENLEWASATRPQKLTLSEVEEIRDRSRDTSYSELAKKYDVSYATICDVIGGETWKSSKL